MNFINNPYGKKSENNPKLKPLNNLNYDFENFLISFLFFWDKINILFLLSNIHKYSNYLKIIT